MCKETEGGQSIPRANDLDHRLQNSSRHCSTLWKLRSMDAFLLKISENLGEQLAEGLRISIFDRFSQISNQLPKAISINFKVMQVSKKV